MSTKTFEVKTMDWHALSTNQIIKSLNTNEKSGLSSSHAKTVLSINGENKLIQANHKSLFVRFLSQFTDFMVIILLIASGISFTAALWEESGDFIDPIIILLIVIVNAIIGVVQESRAQHAIDALKKLFAPSACVIRDSKLQDIPTENIVPGDIICLSAGDYVPADARLIECNALKTQESALTGESLPCKKNSEIVLPSKCPLAERKNMLFSSTIVLSGNAKAVVTQTGMETQVGKIANLLNSEEAPQTPLQKRLAKVGKVLGIGAVLICCVIFLMGLLRNVPLLDSFMLSVSLAVAAIPEGLPAIVTVVLSIGVQRMAKSNAIVRLLPAVETLGAATVICSDKTGTLTQNIMTVTHLCSPEGDIEHHSDSAQNLLSLASLCSNSTFTKSKLKYKAIGEPTENAIVLSAQISGIDVNKQKKEYMRVAEIPFDSQRKLMTTVNKFPSGLKQITKGAPDVIISRCDKFLLGGNTVAITSSNRMALLEQNNCMAKEGLRVIAVAFKDITRADMATENNLVFCGLIGMSDPPRPEAEGAVKICKQAGIIPVMITGDHIITANTIAKKLGILNNNSLSLTGHDLDEMSEQELSKKVKDCRVFARVTPEHKVRIVKAFQKNGDVVAMTGDGVNDAPALKVADIGCAMGKSGTDVAKGAADMILTDDNFATIVKAVEQGRGIYDNIKKAVHFLLSSNIGEILVVFIASLMSLDSPLLPIHLLWVNLVTDSLPAIALGFEKIDNEIMKRKPLSANVGFFSNGLGFDICVEGCLIGAVTLLAFIIGTNMFISENSIMLGRTMAFATLSISELIHAQNMRSRHSIFSIGLFSNKRMVFACIICSLMQVLVIAFEPLARIFKVTTLDFSQWLCVIGLSLVPLIVLETEKYIRHRKTI